METKDIIIKRRKTGKVIVKKEGDKSIRKEYRTRITPQMELFCRLYTTKGDTFNNGTLSYAIAYDFDLENKDTTREVDENGKEIKGTSEYDRVRAVCQNGASRMLFRNYIQERVKELMIQAFDDNKVADTRLTEIMLSGKDTDAIQAIKHRNDLKQRVNRKLDISIVARPMQTLSDEELLELSKE